MHPLVIAIPVGFLIGLLALVVGLHPFLATIVAVLATGAVRVLIKGSDAEGNPGRLQQAAVDGTAAAVRRTRRYRRIR